jgi:hypothetical protein
MMFNGLRIVEDPTLVEVVGEDWSGVRSPARARRRRKKHRQNIKPLYAPIQRVYHLGDKLLCHPAIADQIRAATIKA